MSTKIKDKTLSGILIVLTIIIMFYAMNSEGALPRHDGRPLNEIMMHLITFYFDFLLIGYVFICFQIAGYLELKYKQDFLTMSMICIFLTPLSVFFIFQKNKKND